MRFWRPTRIGRKSSGIHPSESSSGFATSAGLRQDHDREGLRCRLAPADAGDVRTVCASTGQCKADFGEAIGVIGGVECKIHFFAMDLPHSDAIFVVGYASIRRCPT